MGSGKNTPSEETAPEDISPKEHNALDRGSSTENHSEQKKDVAQSASGASLACPKCLSGFRGLITKSQWLRNVGVSLFVTALFAIAQICFANTQADTAERLENLRYVRDRSQVTTPIDLSPQCLRTGEFIPIPESTTTNSSADNKDHFTPELPFKGFDLKGQNLSGLWLNCANFSEANLEGADLSNTYLIGAKLSGANLRNANLRHSQLQLVRLENADLSGADLSGANLSGTPADLSILETATLYETTLPEDNLGLTQQQKERLQELGATFTKEEDEEP
ncbi:pentapeptide repeat-containing protein [Corynebacterium aurimucosum]|uniref:pentapeptide repeat-containing protein n=1 Tax=Corynebacterium aurimucosum TaxID=169292 RepID=UPI0039903F30